MFKVDHDSGKTVTVQQLLTNIDNIAANLFHRGFNRSVPVLFVMVNCLEFVEISLAVLKLGGVVSLINAHSPPGKSNFRKNLPTNPTKAKFCSPGNLQ